jgi:hypothetical protein
VNQSFLVCLNEQIGDIIDRYDYESYEEVCFFIESLYTNERNYEKVVGQKSQISVKYNFLYES